MAMKNLVVGTPAAPRQLSEVRWSKAPAQTHEPLPNQILQAPWRCVKTALINNWDDYLEQLNIH